MAFALNSTLTKSYFFVNPNNYLSYKLFHTTNGIIAYSLEPVDNLPVPQYLLLDPVQSSVTPILQNIMKLCDPNGSPLFDRLSYHVQTSTLVYFCTANNSLLILNEKTYAVQDTIQTGISGNFSEAKLTADGNSLYVLLMGALYSVNQPASQLVQVDLAARKVIGNVVFDQGLGTNEYVNDFVSQNNETYALANLINKATGDTAINIYSVSLTGNSYELLKLASFTNGGNSDFLSQLYKIGDYLFINNLYDLIILDKQEKTVSTYAGMIDAKYSYAQTVSTIPAMVAQDGSSDLYVLFNNDTLSKFTAESGALLSEAIRATSDFQIAYGNHYTSDLLLTADASQFFTITNLQNSASIYSMPNSYSDLLITNSTFGVFRPGFLQIFNRQTNALIGNVSIPTKFYVHKDTDTLYYSASNGDSCVIKQLDLITLSVVDIQNYSDSDLCSDISEFKISDTSSLEFVALSQFYYRFDIVTETHGVVYFDLSDVTLTRGARNIIPPDDVLYIVPDYETLSIYLLWSDDDSITSVYHYEYNGTSFVLKHSYSFDGPAVSSFYPNGGQKVFALSERSLKIVSLESGSIASHFVPTIISQVSSFNDNAGNEHLILSDMRDVGDWSGNVTQPSVFDSNGVSQLPGSNSFTAQAGAAGPCSYWVVDGFISSVGLVKFYDACAAQDAQDTQKLIDMLSIIQ